MEILKKLAEKVAAPFEAFKVAVESKNGSTILGAVKDLVRSAVYAVEEISKSLKEIDIALTGDEKHGLVIDYFKQVAIKQVNKVIDIPFLNEEQEEALFTLILNALIRFVVRQFNKNGWVF